MKINHRTGLKINGMGPAPLKRRLRHIVVTGLAVAMACTGAASVQALQIQYPLLLPASVLTTGCASVTVIGARGSGQSAGIGRPGQPSGFGEEVAGTAMSAVGLLSLPTTVRYDSLRYPAPNVFGGLGYFQSVKKGATQLNAQVVYWARVCPSTKIVLIGYSQGAQAVHLGAATLTPSAASHIRAVVLMSDPVRNIKDVNVSRITVGGLGNHNGILGGGRWFTNGLGGRVVSYCHAGDSICNRFAVPDVKMSVHIHWYETSAAQLPLKKWVAGRLLLDGVS